MSKPLTLVLASQSASRKTMLEAAGVPFEIFPAAVDEAALKVALSVEGQSPRNIADALAEAKALKVSSRIPGALILGSDQLLSLEDGSLFDKPESPDDAKAQLQQLSGNVFRLNAAAVIAENGRAIWRHIATAKMTVRPLSDAFIEAYVAEEWERIRWTVGCFEIEGRGVQLFDRIEGDNFTIMGMPLLPVLGYLRTRGLLTS